MQTLSAADFSGHGLKEQSKAIVLFTAHWCGFCRVFYPHFQKAEKENPNLKFAEAYIDDPDDPLYSALSIDVVPTIIAFCGGTEVSRANGIPGFGLVSSDVERVLKELRGK